MPDKGTRRLRVVERLAGRMYNADDPGGIPWLRRGWTVRQAWLRKAQERLEGTDGFGNRAGAWRDVWGRLRRL